MMDVVTIAASAPPRKEALLEREAALDTLGNALSAAARGCGALLFLAGEAGVGKTALLRRFADREAGAARVLWGACDALVTPRALSPFLDVAHATGGELAHSLLEGARAHEVHRTLVAELERERPSVLVLDDVHWADEATHDVLRLLGRRIGGCGALVVASYRSDELDRAHPLRLVLGELAMTPHVGRLELEPLSPEAVATLAAPHEADPDDLYRTTGGNPFFVTEVLAARTGAGSIPETVRDAVLARTARLGASAQAFLEAAAALTPRAELWLLESLAGEDGLAPLDECLAAGILTAENGSVAFRHELARLAVADSVPPSRSLELHRRVLALLRAHPVAREDLARLAHHAEAAQDPGAVLELAPAAAVHASRRGSHREAAGQYARALRFSPGLPAAEKAALLLQRAWECYLTDQADEGVQALEEAAALYHELGDVLREGVTLRFLGGMLWCPGRVQEAKRRALEAVELLERLPPGHELAMAYNGVAELAARAERREEARVWGRRALELAERLDDAEARGYALNSIGRSELRDGAAGRHFLEQGLEVARRIGHAELEARILFNLVQGGLRDREYGLARTHLEEALDIARDQNVEILHPYLLSQTAVLELETGRWAEALEAALPLALRERTRTVVARTIGLVVLGLVRARRGDPDVWAPLDEAQALAEPTGEVPRITHVAAARAEAAWLEGKTDTVRDEVRRAVELGAPRGSLALSYWSWRAGEEAVVGPHRTRPEAVEMAGDWRRASERWARLGCPYHAAVALLDADDDRALHRALDELHALGAVPAARLAARRLRERGARGLARGPRPTTRRNPAQLTTRELDVLRLVAEGLRNAEIAERLFVSKRTVDHHVSAILRKLGVRTRGQAAEAARRLALLDDG